jgi:hypothetical protein
MDGPMFLFAGAYPDLASAEGDYEVIKLLHSCDDIGSYDAVVISGSGQGRVTVHKSEKPRKRSAWTGLAARAATATVFPFLLPGLVGTGAAGAGIGAWLGHLTHGTSRADAKQIGALLEEGRAGLIVVGIHHDAAKIEQTAVEATDSTLKHLDVDFEEAEREAAAAMRNAP